MHKRLYYQDRTGITMAGPDIQADWPKTADMMFSEARDASFWDPIHIIHVYFRQRPELGKLDEEAVCALDNNYGRIARRILAGTEGYPA